MSDGAEPASGGEKNEHTLAKMVGINVIEGEVKRSYVQIEFSFNEGTRKQNF